MMNANNKAGVKSPEPEDGAGERARIDASCRAPVLFLFASGLFWLLAGTVFGLVASFKMHEPDFFRGFWGVDFGALNFGRMRPAHLNAMAYGWASMTGLGVAIWMIARLCRAPLRAPALVIVSGALWNAGVAVGLAGILTGHSTGIEWLEFPSEAQFLLFCAYALVSIWGIDMLARRKPGHIYISLWYLMAAFFWFPWLFGTANILLLFAPVQGSTHGIINWWYGHNALGLWFTPIGLAAAYYMIPKVLGRPVYSYSLSALGFWSLALFYSWNGGHHLIGGPLPAWLITASIVASIMMLVPVAATAINHHMTVAGNFSALKYSPVLRFVVFGAMAYTAVSLQGSSMAMRGLNRITHFTHYTVGHAHLGLYGFFTMVMFGCMYYIVPRLVQAEWRSAALIKAHFYLCAGGIGVMFLFLTIGGLMQGFTIENPINEFGEVVKATLPYLIARSFTGVMLAAGHALFVAHFFMMLIQLGRKFGEPTLFTDATHIRGEILG